MLLHKAIYLATFLYFPKCAENHETASHTVMKGEKAPVKC